MQGLDTSGTYFCDMAWSASGGPTVYRDYHRYGGDVMWHHNNGFFSCTQTDSHAGSGGTTGSYTSVIKLLV